MATSRAGLYVQRLAVVMVLVVAVVLGITLLRSGGASADKQDAPSSATPAARASSIAYDALPAEAQSTLGRIRDGGPFPYSQDGSVFENREALLPNQPVGYYHEYTVDTPGQADRGPRRIVLASDGTLYWSPDHYQTFRQITGLPSDYGSTGA